MSEFKRSENYVSEYANGTVMKLPEVLDLTAAEGFLESMRQQAVGTLCLDASAVRTITLRRMALT